MIYDSIVIGAGAAGLMAAISAKRAGASSVLLLDSKPKIGAKILMSGGTRCNLTNQKVTERDFQTEEKNIAKSVLQYFPSEKAVEFFKQLGIEVVLEDDGKFFPNTHSGRTVLEALEKEIQNLGVELQSAKKITQLSYENNLFHAAGNNFALKAKTVILATGGLSFPTTGSDGTGYQLAQSLGHSLIPTSPSLTPLYSEDKIFHELSGLSLEATLSLWQNGKKTASYTGSFLFTHFGFSGPVVLNISRHWIRNSKNQNIELLADFMPGTTQENFRKRFMDQIAQRPERQIKTFLQTFVPERFAEAALKKSGIPSDEPFTHLPRENREDLFRVLYHCPLSIKSAMGYEKAEVTAGGIPLSEVHRKTLESKFQPRLFFAGEILDVDGRIGGFNFQWAWSSGVVAGEAAAKALQN